MSALEARIAQRVGIDEETLASAQSRRREGKSTAEVLADGRTVTEQDWARALAETLRLPFLSEIETDEIPLDVIEKIPIQHARRNGLLPYRSDESGLHVVTANPADPAPIDDLRVLSRRPVHASAAAPSIVQSAINRAYDQLSGSTEAAVEGLGDEGMDLATGVEETRDLLDADDEGPIIKLVNTIIFQAVKDRASDIHIEPFERELVVRFRVDGILEDVAKPPKRFQPTITSRVKIMAGLNIAEKRLPQDGRIRTRLAGRDVDVRVSTVPTAYGERVVMRILDRTSTILSLDELGLSGSTKQMVERLIRQSHGILLVTGPTGSGKTTTLYACLTKINANDKNIITIEDPIEYQIHGVGQIQVNPKIELTFASGLRSVLRQDPDVIMVGEIRDVETAEIAIHSALTGHLVFSTLHTNDSFGAVTRLVDMGIEPFLVSSSVIGVMAQRLIRRICTSCAEIHEPSPVELREIGIDPAAAVGKTFYRAGPGCKECRQRGYQGRIGIHELLVVNDEIRNLVMKKADASEIRRAATAHGMKTLRDDGADKVLRGMTTIEEVLRVTQDDFVAEEGLEE